MHVLVEGLGHDDLLDEQDGPAAAGEVGHEEAVRRDGHDAVGIGPHQDGPPLLNRYPCPDSIRR
ncbi:hypothetical protein AB0L17_35030 [Streptomyces cellulosae]